MEAGRKKLLEQMSKNLDAQQVIKTPIDFLGTFFGGMYAKDQLGIPRSQPTPVDVSAEGMKKKSKTLTKGTGVTYSGIKTSSQGLLVGANTEKKTLLGG